MSMIFIPKYIRPKHSSFIYSDCMLFHDMTSQELDQLDQMANQTKCDIGEYLFRQNTPADYVYNVITGTAVLERVSSNGRLQVICFLFPGDYIGLSKSTHYDWAVRCLTKTELYKFSRKKLTSMTEKSQHLKTNMEKINSRIFSRVMEQLYVLGQKKAHERLCFLFMQLLERSPGSTVDRIELYMSRQDIADYLGLTIETVSRSLSKLKDMGLIEFPKLNHLRIVDINEVSELACV